MSAVNASSLETIVEKSFLKVAEPQEYHNSDGFEKVGEIILRSFLVRKIILDGIM